MMAKTKRSPKAARLRNDALYIWQRHTGWELALLFVGLLSFVGIVVILFLPIGKGPALVQASGPVPSVGSSSFLTLLSSRIGLPIDSGSRPKILEDGDAIIDSLLKDIDGARSNINVMTYIWKDGKLSDTLIDHLMKRQKAGVQVRLLLDAYGGLKAPSRKLEDLKKLGAKVATFHTLLPAPWTFMRSTKRNHRRAIVIDGTRGYTGGLGVDDVWLGKAQPPQWHDLMFRVTGTFATRLDGSFAELWSATTGELLTAYTESTEPPEVKYLTLSASPSPDLYEMETFILLSLMGAQHDIKIETPYFLPNASIRKILKDKARRGLDVTILVPNENTDEKSVRWAGQRIYSELLEAGVKIYEYQPTFTHTKLLLEDGSWSVFGSANMDIRSRRLNDEVVFGVQDTTLATSLGEVFARDLKKARPISLQTWEARNPIQRVLEILSQAFVQQY